MRKCLLLFCVAFFCLIFGCNASADNLINIDSSKVSRISVDYISQSAKADISDSQIIKDVLKSLKDTRGKEIKSADIWETAFNIKLFQNDEVITDVSFGITADGLRVFKTEKRSYRMEEEVYNVVVSGVLDAMRTWCTQFIPVRDIPLTGNGVLTLDKDTIVFSSVALDNIKRVKVLDCPSNKTLQIDGQTQNDLIASLRTLSFESGMRLPFPFVLKPSPRYRIELLGDAQDQNVFFTVQYYEEESSFQYAVILPDQSLIVLTSKTSLPVFR